MRDLSALFAAICANQVSRVPSLREFLEQKPVTAVAVPRRETRTGYQGDYPVFSALDFHVILNNVGRKAEVVGRVTEVKDGTTKYGKPYVFVNFGFWKGDIFKLSICSEGLDEFRAESDHSWVGRWVSAVGLLDEPYSNPKFGYTHCGITINDPSQVRFISEREAIFQLGKGGQPDRETGGAGHSGTGNRDVLCGYFGEDDDSERTEGGAGWGCQGGAFTAAGGLCGALAFGWGCSFEPGTSKEAGDRGEGWTQHVDGQDDTDATDATNHVPEACEGARILPEEGGMGDCDNYLTILDI